MLLTIVTSEIVSIKKELFFSPGADVPHVYMYMMHAWMLCCFCTFISTQKIWKALTAMVDSCAMILIKKYPFSGITNSDRVWRKMPECHAQSVLLYIT